MTFEQGIKHKGAPYYIKDTSREEFPMFLARIGLKTGLEIGTHKGYNTERFCKAGLKMYTVDPWRFYPDFTKRRTSKEEGIKKMEIRYHKACKRLKKYGVMVLKKTSMEALQDFEDESLDFVYIDGNHKLKFAIEDIYEWSKKVRKGGIVSGHDYLHPNDHKKRYWAWVGMHAKFAVDAFTQAYRINNWYVFGDKDVSPSWFWFK